MHKRLMAKIQREDNDRKALLIFLTSITHKYPRLVA